MKLLAFSQRMFFNATEITVHTKSHVYTAYCNILKYWLLTRYFKDWILDALLYIHVSIWRVLNFGCYPSSSLLWCSSNLNPWHHLVFWIDLQINGFQIYTIQQWMPSPDWPEDIDEILLSCLQCKHTSVGFWGWWWTLFRFLRCTDGTLDATSFSKFWGLVCVAGDTAICIWTPWQRVKASPAIWSGGYTHRQRFVTPREREKERERQRQSIIILL